MQKGEIFKLERERERKIYQHEIVVTTGLLGSNIILVNYVTPKHHGAAQQENNSRKVTVENSATELHGFTRKKNKTFWRKYLRWEINACIF